MSRVTTRICDECKTSVPDGVDMILFATLSQDGDSLLVSKDEFDTHVCLNKWVKDIYENEKEWDKDEEVGSTFLMGLADRQGQVFDDGTKTKPKK